MADFNLVLWHGFLLGTFSLALIGLGFSLKETWRYFRDRNQ